MNPHVVDPAVMQVIGGSGGRANFGNFGSGSGAPGGRSMYDNAWGSSGPAQQQHGSYGGQNSAQNARQPAEPTGPVYSFDQWMGMLDSAVVEDISALIDDGLLKESDLDSSALEELHNRAAPEAHAALRLYREIRNGTEIRNPSAYITKLLKNPGGGRGGGRGGRGGRGRGGDGRGGRAGGGRGRGGNFNPEWADYATEKLQEALGPRYIELDDKALAFAKKSPKKLIDHLVEEYATQSSNVRNVSAWVTKILFANSQTAREAGGAPAPAGAGAASSAPPPAE